jgi:hypothetical protein
LNTELFGYISGILVAICIIPYSIRIWQKKITPSPTSWLLWSILGLALLLTYKSSGAQDNIWPAVFGFTNPTLIFLLILARQRGRLEKITEKTDLCCLAAGIISLLMWTFMRKYPHLVQYALYVAILADLFAAIPTIILYWNSPMEDRPFAWGLFSIGYGLAIFAISEYTIANYVLPLYMFAGSMSVTLILSIPRIKNRISLREWI